MKSRKRDGVMTGAICLYDLSAEKSRTGSVCNEASTFTQETAFANCLHPHWTMLGMAPSLKMGIMDENVGLSLNFGSCRVPGAQPRGVAFITGFLGPYPIR